jgi:hypothetical protein
MVEKTKDICVIPTLASCSFDLWMFRVGFNTFAIIVSFINISWEPCHVTIKFFEVHNTTSVPMANYVNFLLDSFGLLDKIIAYVKDEGSNLNTLIFALTSIVSCFNLQQACPFVGSCFGHAMSKANQYLTNKNNVCVGFSKVSLKEVQFSLQKTITWINVFGKGRQEWKKSCSVGRLFAKMLKTLMKTSFASQVILFCETLEYWNVIVIYYKWQHGFHLSSIVLVFWTWVIVQAIINTFLLVMKLCVLNQSVRCTLFYLYLMHCHEN